MEEIYGEPGEPVARCTPLGSICVGSPEKCLSSESSCYVQSFHVHTSADLDYALRKFWELDAIGMNNDNNDAYTPEGCNGKGCCIMMLCGRTLRGRNTLDSRRSNTGKQLCASPKEIGKFGTIFTVQTRSC